MDLTWKTEYNTGGASVDGQHQKLFEMLASIRLELIDPEINPETVKVAFKELFDYSEKHFKHEESQMRECGYPEIDLHINIHLDFLKKIEQSLGMYLEGSITIVELLDFSATWFNKHIVEEDHKVNAYFEEVGFKVD